MRTTSSELVRRRMRNMALWGTPCTTPQEVLRRLGAMQAQEHSFARWSVAQRTKTVTGAMIDRAFDDGALLRTHILRPTWHYVLPEDLRWMLTVSAPRVHARNAPRYRELQIDEKTAAKANRVMAKALTDRHLTRAELAGVLEKKGIAPDGQRLPYLLMHAELDAVVCSGAMRGKQHTYAAFDERVPATKPRDAEESLAELTRRYFSARGPATVKDYAVWASLTVAQAGRGIEMAGDALERDVFGGRTFWFAEEGTRGSTPRKKIDLIQCYDEAIMSYSESRDVLGSEITFAVPRTIDGFTHVVLLDGRLLGHWRVVRERASVVLEANLRRRLDPSETKALDKAVGRYGRFSGAPVRLKVVSGTP